MLIRSLDKDLELDSVLRFYNQAPDYWELTEGQKQGPEKAISFFIDTPPNCDPDRSFRLGIFLNERLLGLAELSFGFPKIGDPYLGFMMLGPWARNSGIGIKFLDHVKYLARQAGRQKLFLAMLSINPKGRAFWECREVAIEPNLCAHRLQVSAALIPIPAGMVAKPANFLSR